jgi:D-methionine transport system permease protein
MAKAIVGKTYGSEVMILALTVAAIPYISRVVESSLNEVDKGVVEAASSIGANSWQIITKVLLPEAKPSLINGGIIAIVTILGYSAMADMVSGGGLGEIAISLGFDQFNDDIVWFCVLLTIIIVQVIQELGMYIVRKTDKRNK